MGVQLLFQEERDPNDSEGEKLLHKGPPPVVLCCTIEVMAGGHDSTRANRIVMMELCTVAKLSRHFVGRIWRNSQRNECLAVTLLSVVEEGQSLHESPDIIAADINRVGDLFETKPFEKGRVGDTIGGSGNRN